MRLIIFVNLILHYLLSTRWNITISLVCRDQKPRFKLDLNFVCSVALLKSFHLCLPPLAHLFFVMDSLLKHSVPVGPISFIIINQDDHSQSTSHFVSILKWGFWGVCKVWRCTQKLWGAPPIPERENLGMMAEPSLPCSQFLCSFLHHSPSNPF